MGNIYAPIQERNRNFFPQIKNKIQSLQIAHFILAGDLNCVTNLSPTDTDPTITNIDTLHMSAIPNLHHSQTIVSWIQNGFILDKYRSLYPYKRDFDIFPLAKLK